MMHIQNMRIKMHNFVSRSLFVMLTSCFGALHVFLLISFTQSSSKIAAEMAKTENILFVACLLLIFLFFNLIWESFSTMASCDFFVLDLCLLC